MSVNSNVSSMERKPPASFYVTGGTLAGDASSYVSRKADSELFESLLSGEYCHLLDTRQVGKSSLMVRTAALLRERGIRVAALDVSILGRNVTSEQWYAGLLHGLGTQINLETELEAHWEQHRNLNPSSRWITALTEVALPATPKGLVVFVDEIDSVRSLPFSTDEFFASIRALYNQRSLNPSLAMLTFCLIGVASPSDLIRDPHITPFNIGVRIELTDFSFDEARVLSPLRYGQTGALLEGPDPILRRILFWTGGHPYLTQRLCRTVAELDTRITAGQVDSVCATLFLNDRIHGSEPNIMFARDRLLSGLPPADPASVLSLWSIILKRPVVFEPSDARMDLLRLAGIARIAARRLVPRNEIYRRAFGSPWIAEHMPGQEIRRQKAAYRRGLFRAGLAFGLPLIIVLSATAIAVHYNKLALDASKKLQNATYALKAAKTDRDNFASDSNRLKASIIALNKQKQIDENTKRKVESNLKGLTKEFAAIEGKLSTAQGTEIRLNHEVAGFRSSVAELKREQMGVQARIAELTAPLSNALSENPETAYEGVKYGLQAVSRPSDATNRYTPLALQGLANAVNKGIYRRLVLTHDSGVLTASFSHNSRWILTAAKSGVCTIWEASTGQRRFTFDVQNAPAPNENINTAEFSNDDRTILTAADGVGVQLWDFTDQTKPPRKVIEVAAPARMVTFAAWSFDNKKVAYAVENANLGIYDIKEKRHVRPLIPAGQSMHTGNGHLRTVAWSHDGGRLVTAGSDNSARIWNAETGKLVGQPIRLPQEQVYLNAAGSHQFTSARFAKDNSLILISTMDGYCLQWMPEKNEMYRRLNLHTDWVWNIVESPVSGTYLATASRDGTVGIWLRDNNGRPLHVLRGHSGQVFSARFNADDTEIVTAGDDHTAQVWRRTDFIQETTGSPFTQVSLSPDGRMAAIASTDAFARVRFVSQFGKVKEGENVHSENIRSGTGACAWSPSGDCVFFLQLDGRLLRLPIDKAAAPQSYDGIQALLDIPYKPRAGMNRLGLSVSGDGHQIAACLYDEFVIVDIPSKTVSRRIKWTGPINSAEFLAGSKSLLISSKDGRVEIFVPSEAATLRRYVVPGTQTGPHSRGREQPLWAALSPDGRYVGVASSDHNGYIFDAATSAMLCTLNGHGGSVNEICFSRDTKHIATASEDRTARIWDIVRSPAGQAEFRPSFVVRGHVASVTGVAFTAKGEELMSCSADNTFRKFPVTVEKVKELANYILQWIPRANWTN